MFLLATPFPLGEVKNLRLQHDNSGGHPSWYLNKVTIQDLQTRQVWHFFCDCWLSADREDGLTKKTFNAAKNNEIASFRSELSRFIVLSRTSTGFRDEHIWVSVLDPPSRSPFTRAQRVSCCMSLLLCTMAINIAFWNIPIDKDSAVVFSFGKLWSLSLVIVHNSSFSSIGVFLVYLCVLEILHFTLMLHTKIK
uniref:PLAT domain-containing protein n=1 Tax=Mastacembelus armatus TaxID=205130 RepID=A0A7N9AV44_9TELE